LVAVGGFGGASAGAVGGSALNVGAARSSGGGLHPVGGRSKTLMYSPGGSLNILVSLGVPPSGGHNSTSTELASISTSSALVNTMVRSLSSDLSCVTWAGAVKSEEVSRVGATLGVPLTRATVGLGAGGPGSWPATTERAGPDRQKPGKPQSAGLPALPCPHDEPVVGVARATTELERWVARSCHILFTVALILAASAAGVGRNGGWPWQPCVRARGQYCWSDCTRSFHSRHCKKPG
jgi:hypothetical protein